MKLFETKIQILSQGLKQPAAKFSTKEWILQQKS